MADDGGSNDFSTWRSSCQAIQRRCYVLGTLEIAHPSTIKCVRSHHMAVVTGKTVHNELLISHVTTAATGVCLQCQSSHFFNQCKIFRQVSCQKKLQHQKFDEKPVAADSTPPATTSTHTVSVSFSQPVKLSSVFLHILDANGHPHVNHTALDTEYESHMDPDRLAPEKLKLKTIPTRPQDAPPILNRVHGITGTKTTLTDWPSICPILARITLADLDVQNSTPVDHIFELESTQSRLAKLEAQYSHFIEYIRLGHVTEAASEKASPYSNKPSNFLPLHAVSHLDSLTTKPHVVRDSSAKTSTGLSLSDALQVAATFGPSLINIKWHALQLTKLSEANLWFPRQNKSTWPCPSIEEVVHPKMTTLVALLSQESGPLPVFKRLSSFRKLRRVIAFVLRFKTTRRCPCNQPEVSELTVGEMTSSIRTFIRAVQQQDFLQEVQPLKESQLNSKKSSDYSLNLFLDPDGVLKVSGRLNHFNPPVEDNRHTGAQVVMSIVRQRFWPQGTVRLARSIRNCCVRCSRRRPKTTDQFISDLRTIQVTTAHLFVITGAVHAGPLTLKQAKLVVMATKATCRLMFRHGLCETIFSRILEFDDPERTTASSPGQFIIGRPLNAITEPVFTDMRLLSDPMTAASSDTTFLAGQESSLSSNATPRSINLTSTSAHKS